MHEDVPLDVRVKIIQCPISYARRFQHEPSFHACIVYPINAAYIRLNRKGKPERWRCFHGSQVPLQILCGTFQKKLGNVMLRNRSHVSLERRVEIRLGLKHCAANGIEAHPHRGEPGQAVRRMMATVAPPPLFESLTLPIGLLVLFGEHHHCNPGTSMTYSRSHWLRTAIESFYGDTDQTAVAELV